MSTEERFPIERYILLQGGEQEFMTSVALILPYIKGFYQYRQQYQLTGLRVGVRRIAGAMSIEFCGQGNFLIFSGYRHYYVPLADESRTGQARLLADELNRWMSVTPPVSGGDKEIWDGNWLMAPVCFAMRLVSLVFRGYQYNGSGNTCSPHFGMSYPTHPKMEALYKSMGYKQRGY